MKTLYIEGDSGVSGDMFVGALLDAGGDEKLLRESINALGLPDLSIKTRRVERAGVEALKFDVVDAARGILSEKSQGHSHRGLTEIESLITSSSLDPKVKEDAIGVFGILAEAEARVHQVTVDDLHFHEVGAVDSIVDIVSAAVLVNSLGISEGYARPPMLGSGTVRCAHGLMGVPVPATLEILKGRPVRRVEAENPTGELVTPTGAALLVYFCRNFSAPPPFEVLSEGHGAGGRKLPFPNVLKATVGMI